MTGPDVEAARKRLGMSAADLGRALRLEGRDPGQTVRRWETGHTPVPGPAQVALEYMLKEAKAAKAAARAEKSSAQAIPRSPQAQEPRSETEPVDPRAIGSVAVGSSAGLKTRRRG
jgi:hypothetical protein